MNTYNHGFFVNVHQYIFLILNPLFDNGLPFISCRIFLFL
jgi:hypothetical protein